MWQINIGVRGEKFTADIAYHVARELFLPPSSSSAPAPPVLLLEVLPVGVPVGEGRLAPVAGQRLLQPRVGPLDVGGQLLLGEEGARAGVAGELAHSVAVDTLPKIYLERQLREITRGENKSLNVYLCVFMDPCCVNLAPHWSHS